MLTGIKRQIVRAAERPPTRQMLRVARNGVSLLATDAANRVTSFLLYALVARRLGTLEFGQMSLALTLLHTFQTFAMAGGRTFITRAVARNKTGTDAYFVNGSAVVIVTSLLSIAGLALLVRILNYSTGTAALILLFSLGLLPYALSTVCEGIFQAWERMHYIVQVNAPVNVAKVALAFVFLSRGHGLTTLALVLFACQTAALAIEWWLMLGRITRPRLTVDPHFSLAIARASSPFLGINGLVAIRTSANVMLLSKFAGETDVGFFNAAGQVLGPLALVIQSTASSLFPMMCQRYDSGFAGMKRISERLTELLLAMAVPAAVGLFFVADSVLLLSYGKPDFQAASGVLRITVWNVVLTALTTALGQVLLAGLRERVNLRIVAVNALVALALGLVLTDRFGLRGAAVAALLTGVVNFAQHYVPVSRLLPGYSLWRLGWKPVAASACMAVYLSLAGGLGLFLTVVSAAGLYATLYLLLLAWETGGPRQLLTRTFGLRPER